MEVQVVLAVVEVEVLTHTWEETLIIYLQNKDMMVEPLTQEHTGAAAAAVPERLVILTQHPRRGGQATVGLAYHLQ
jgi:hypothetical protein